jgi:hypothetical protein
MWFIGLLYALFGLLLVWKTDVLLRYRSIVLQLVFGSHYKPSPRWDTFITKFVGYGFIILGGLPTLVFIILEGLETLSQLIKLLN